MTALGTLASVEVGAACRKIPTVLLPNQFERNRPTADVR